ncbi:MAG: DUF4292 domain-containing protein [Bacteroidales bacterium]|nr:DUF4292 domain-containing protein [Bacteroidales bacterium]
MRSRTILCAVGAALLALSGCRTLRDPGTSPPPPEAPAAAKRSYTVISFTGTVEGISVNGQVRLAQDSVIWGNASKIIEVGRAMATPDSVWVRSAVLGINESTDYQRLQRHAGRAVTFDWLQETLLSDNAEERLNTLARSLGYNATIRITRREQVDRLTFPFTK